MALGYPDKARPHVERAVGLNLQLHGAKHPAAARALTARGRLRLSAGDYAGAEEDFRKVLAQMPANDPNHSFHHSLMAEALFRQANLEGARRHFEAALGAMRRQFDTQHVATATMINNVAAVADDAVDAAGAEKLFAEAASILRGLPGPPGNLVFPMFGLQRAHFFRGEYARAKELCEEAYQTSLRAGGDRHPNTAVAMLSLGLVKAHLGDADALDLTRKALALQRSIYPSSHIEISRGLTVLGRVLILRGSPAQAEPLLRESLEIARKVYPKSNWRAAELRVFLGLALAGQGRRVEAAEAFEAGLREMRAALPDTHPRVVEARRIREQSFGPAGSGDSLD